MYVYKLFLTFISFNVAFAAINGRCSSGNGVCVSTSSCTKAGGTYKSGLCPNDPNDVKCCNKSCKVNGASGTCKFTGDCKGKHYSGYCPGGTNFQCCIESSGGGGGGGSTKGTEIVKTARTYVGKLKYVYGGTSLTSGVDCSGFTQQIFKKFNISLQRTASQQSNQGKAVTISSNNKGISNAKPGDLLFNCSGSSVTHVMIYAGNGKLIDAPGTGRTVSERSLWTTPCKIRRFV